MSTDGLQASFSIHRSSFQLNVDLSLGHGLTVIMGPSGSGKTTLLRALAGLNQLTRGTIRLDGKDITELPPESRSVGFVFQNSALFPHLSVEENIAFGAAKGEQGRWLEELKLKTYAHRKPDTLSGGEKQRVAIARALARRPTLLLLDEPVTALDVEARTEILQLIQAVTSTERLTTLVVTHSREDAIALSPRRICIEKGNLRSS